MSFTGRPPPKPEEIFITPPSFVPALRTLAKKMQGSGANWAISSDLAENLLGVHIRPTEVEVVTDMNGLREIRARLSEFSPPEPVLTEKTLAREAEIQNEMHPVRTRSNLVSFKINEVLFLVHGDFQFRVGGWDWGDPVLFDAQSVNVAGSTIPVMPLRIASEIYLTLGWLDRVEMISDAVTGAPRPTSGVRRRACLLKARRERYRRAPWRERRQKR